MVAAHAIYFPLLSAFSAVFIFAGRLTVSNELKQTETDAVCIRGRMIWTILAAAGTAGTAVSFLIFRQIPPFRLFFLYYVFLYSSLIGIVDFYSHNYYLEMLPWLLPFILLGCITWGVTDALFGLLAGGCIGTVLALTEWLFFRKLSYGGGDTVYGAAASALIGYRNFISYWTAFRLILLAAAAVHIISVRLIRKQSLEENRFVPLLPWFSILTTVFYAFLITGG